MIEHNRNLSDKDRRLVTQIIDSERALLERLRTKQVQSVILRAIRSHWRKIPPNPPFRKGGEWIVAPLPRTTIKTSVTNDQYSVNA